MKRILIVTALTTAMFAASVAQAASYQDRSMATGAVVGATTGAVVGSASHQVVEGAVFGAVLGTIAGAVIASQHEPVYVARNDVRPHYRPVAHVYQPRHHAYVQRDHHRSMRPSAYAWDRHEHRERR
ncbi:hypothetical protein FE236_06360 [Mariprofundus erugo]|uniref:glycine zipper domain-containing protein n=1 Tax=Mariprofundus erugo TaxID=2528639 RepID=UPI0010FE2EAF|nr:glycine zipper domain-containing protein [Mariprofundus erugo]TLS76477.1 hypothetical protein FE236_06360 [Mariprofundus erugo]